MNPTDIEKYEQLAAKLRAQEPVAEIGAHGFNWTEHGFNTDTPNGTKFYLTNALESADAIEALVARVRSQEPVADFRGYAALGTGQYLLNACPATDDLPPELVIEVATEEQKVGRVIGDLKDVEPGTNINPDRIAIRIAFFSVAGLDALEQQLRILREESFPDTTHAPDSAARIEGLESQVRLANELFAKQLLRADDLTEKLRVAREAIDYCIAQVPELKTVPGIASALVKINGAAC